MSFMQNKNSRRVEMKAIILAFIFIFSLSFASASVRINEVKPEGIEWIEVWNEDKITLNLNNWTIKDNSTDKPDTLSCKNIIDCSLITDTEFFLILGNATKIEDITKESIIYFYTDDTKIGNGLTDNGDIIILK